MITMAIYARRMVRILFIQRLCYLFCATDDGVGPRARVRSLKKFVQFLDKHPHLQSYVVELQLVGPYPAESDWGRDGFSGEWIRSCTLPVFEAILNRLPRLKRLRLDYILFPRDTIFPDNHPRALDCLSIHHPYNEGDDVQTQDILDFLRLFGHIGELHLDSLASIPMT